MQKCTPSQFRTFTAGGKEQPLSNPISLGGPNNLLACQHIFQQPTARVRLFDVVWVLKCVCQCQSTKFHQPLTNIAVATHLISHATTVKVQPAPCNLAVFHKHCVFIFDRVLLAIIIESPRFIYSVHIPLRVFFNLTWRSIPPTLLSTFQCQ